MDLNRRESLSQQLQAKGVTLPCPRCGHLRFSVIGEAVLQIASGGGLLGFPRDVPAVVLGCNNCGYLTHHAIAVVQQPDGLLGRG